MSRYNNNSGFVGDIVKGVIIYGLIKMMFPSFLTKPEDTEQEQTEQQLDEAIEQIQVTTSNLTYDEQRYVSDAAVVFTAFDGMGTDIYAANNIIKHMITVDDMKMLKKKFGSKMISFGWTEYGPYDLKGAFLSEIDAAMMKLEDDEDINGVNVHTKITSWI